MPPLTRLLRDEYLRMFAEADSVASRRRAVHAILDRIEKGRERYARVEETTGVPWFFTAIIHQLEGSGRFTTHLHNGDSLQARTVQVPRGRPVAGIPPFTWEESAADALTWEGYAGMVCWSVSALLYRFERYNGFGYRRRNKPSPYLWSFSTLYKRGKFVADGSYDPNAVSAQCGAGVLLRALEAHGVLPEEEPESTFASMLLTPFDPTHYHLAAKKLQRLLNSLGYNLNPDGKAGPKTSDACFQFTGQYLSGDPRS